MFSESERKQTSIVLRRSAIALAASLALASGAVYAQSNTTGNIFGRVEASAGTTVVIENVGTGLKRTLTPDASGRFVVTSLPVGTYKATLYRGGVAVSTQDNINVIIGQGSEVEFGSVQTLQAVQVVGRVKAIDISNTNNGANFSAKQLESLPAVRSVDNIIQLAPNTTTADSRYAGGASFGGGGASENAYYINGFPVTNPLTQLGSSSLPFGAIGQAQVLTGGFGAEFGRSVGGVVNIQTKSGTNQWEAGVQYSIKPNAWRDRQVDLYYPVTGDSTNANTDGTLRVKRSANVLNETTIGGYIGGPLIKDKLFMFAAVEQIKQTSGFVSQTRDSTTSAVNGWDEDRLKTTRALGKFDWNLTDDHRLELTLIGDKPTADRKLMGFDYATGTHSNTVTSASHFQNVDNITTQGSDAKILKYTGDLTQDLTLQLLVGESKATHISDYAGFDRNQPGVTFANSITSKAPGVSYPVLNPISGQNIDSAGATDKVKSFRLDVEYRLGKHTIRAGLDDNKLTSLNAGQNTAGGATLLYTKASATQLANPNFSPSGAGGQTFLLADPKYGSLANAGYYGRETIFISTTSAYSDQTAQYIEDKYQATKNLLLTAGIRREGYNNKNGDKEKFLEMNNQINPRFAAAWDVNGDASLKVFGSAGRYSLQIPTHIAVRGASRSTFTRQFFTYTGVDAKGLPTGRINVTTPFSANNEYGQPKDAKTVAALDMKPTNQDEMTLGIEKALMPDLSGGVKMTYRKLKNTIDDMCDYRPFDAWLARNPSVDTSNWRGFGCASINPGIANSFLIDFGDGGPDAGKHYTKVDLTAEDLKLPKAKRSYFALDFFLEHALKNGWYGKVMYTYSKNKGNTEGQTLSDVAQTDVAATQTWDHWELMDGAFGYLPNDRRHQLKAYGFVQVTPEWQVGANLLLASGRPKNCIGFYAGPGADTDEFANVDYGSSYRYCDGKPAPRGSAGNLPWQRRLDLNVVYRPAIVKGLELKLDIANVTGEQTPQTVDEVYNSTATGGISPTYGRVISTTAPFSMRFTAGYNIKF